MFLLYFVIFIRLSIIKSTRRLLSKHFGHFHNFQVNFQFINNELITPTLIICSSTSDSAAWAFFFSLLLTHSSQPAVLQITEKVPALCSPHPRSPASVTLPVTQRNSESCSNKETIELMHTHTRAHTHAQTVQACHPQWSFRPPDMWTYAHVENFIETQK